MRLSRTLWSLAGLAACIVQIAVACGNDLQGSESANGQTPKDDGTVLLSVVVTKSGVVRDTKVLGGPTTLQSAALRAVKGWKYNRKQVENWGTTPVGNSARSMMLAVTFPTRKGARPEIRQAMPAGVPSCVHPVPVRIELPPWLNLWLSEQPVIPVLASETKK